MNVGKFICFCGLDGSGKTTQATLLVEWLKKQGYAVLHIEGFKPPKFSRELKEIANKCGKSFFDLFSDEMRTCSYIKEENSFRRDL